MSGETYPSTFQYLLTLIPTGAVTAPFLTDSPQLHQLPAPRNELQEAFTDTQPMDVTDPHKNLNMIRHITN